MDFILIEAIEEDDEFKLVFSDDSSDEEFSEEEELNFIDDDEGEEQQPSFYGSVDNGERVRFSNQTRNPDEVFDESKDEYYSEDDMPEFCTTQKKGKVLNLICLTIILINLRYLKRAFCVSTMWKISFFMLYFMVSCMLKRMVKMFNFKVLKKFWELNFSSN